MQSVPQFAAYVGIDVSARQLDGHVLPAGTSFRLPNTRSGIWDLISQLAEMDEVLVVLEATGGLQRETASGASRTGGYVLQGMSARYRAWMSLAGPLT